MKKLLLGLFLMSVLVLTACSSTDDTEKENKDKEKTEAVAADSKTEKDESVGVDKGLFNVEVTLPASFFEGEDIDTAIAEAKADGIKEATKNADGSVTYKMSKDKHKEMMSEMEVGVKEYMDELVTDDYPSIREVTANKEYSTYTLTVDKALYEDSFDGFASMGLGMMGMYYQVFDGVDAENAKVEINVQDEATSEVFETIVFPDDMEEE
ncbi:MAG: hypothetical protein R3328_10735 [Planococcaceae bacterium]|nr:hypothetical protein [Bacillota bacterium]MDX1771994.1 hypothetical protein [Planococcaceae bacterium]